MKNKLYIILYVPLIERSFDLYIPVVKKIGSVKNLIIKIVSDASDGTFIDDGCKKLYDKITGEVLDEEQFVKSSKLKNGSKLILY